VRKLISLGILAAFLAAVTVPSMGCSKGTGSGKASPKAKAADDDPSATKNPKKDGK